MISPLSVALNPLSDPVQMVSAIRLPVSRTIFAWKTPARTSHCSVITTTGFFGQLVRTSSFFRQAGSYNRGRNKIRHDPKWRLGSSILYSPKLIINLIIFSVISHLQWNLEPIFKFYCSCLNPNFYKERLQIYVLTQICFLLRRVLQDNSGRLIVKSCSLRLELKQVLAIMSQCLLFLNKSF